MDVVLKNISEVIPYARNPRKNQAIDKVAASLKEFGFRQPIVVDKEMVIIAGHTRFAAAQKLGLKEVPVHIADNMTPGQVKAYRIADNRVAQDSEWDLAMLNTEFTDLLDINFDLDVLGFDPKELEDLIVDKEGLTEDDWTPPIPPEPQTKAGDLYILDKHKLLCGDATKTEDVSKLMGDNLADLIVTDPPYNVAYGGGRAALSSAPWARVKAHGAIMNDDMTPDEFNIFIDKCFDNYHKYLKDLASVYVFHGDSKTEAKITFETYFAKYFTKSCTLIWNKGSAGLGYSDYRPSHEPILYGWKKGKGSHYWCGDKTKKTVLDYSKGNTRDYVHPTQKPVGILTELIKNSSKGQDIVIDFFSGSGSTLISCEKLDRVFFGLEYDPKYCDVIIKRWEDFTGKKAKLVQD